MARKPAPKPSLSQRIATAHIKATPARTPPARTNAVIARELAKKMTEAK